MPVLTDLRPLRENRTFRRLWLGTTASGFGGQFGAFAVVFYVWDRTHSAAAVGLVGLAIGVPLILLALAGSAFTDHVDRRRLALRCTCAQIVITAAMTVVAFTDLGGVPAMLALTAVQSALGGLVGPARQTFVPALLTGERLAAGLALNHLSFQLAMLLGPAAAGGLTAVAGVGWCLAFDTFTFTAALVGLAGLPSGVPPSTGAPGFAAVKAGFSYAVRTPPVRGALMADLAATLFAMPVALFPVINEERFGGRPEILGLFTTAVAVGGVAASILSGLATHQPRPGRLLLICGAVWAAALGLTGVATSLPLTLSLLALAGAADTWAVVSRGTVIQTETPPAYRGRISSLEHIAGAAGPQLGNLRAGLVAAATSGGTALLLGGATALAATGLIALSTPALRAFRTVPSAD
ncbi:MFS transporter [Paractinoplanes brasiliensis]|uniref:Putative MFS family arabinose efflux permease n=1 Tax=Paractinoplanes brasiliensis TaxID=52695 RepID=A0A4R6JZK9_9ACTN|nr:MFS transporter [Actinoplanes brasiliensis]TDO42353.1 putative MFS family arabinose efflux permease [Actinoplanes brasiliensis]GID29585.1 MFS transporter [Actinoplanes brasiliensis]